MKHCSECSEPVGGRHKSSCGKRAPESDYVFPEDCTLKFDDLLRLLLAICPTGSMGEDNDGQLVFYTDKTMDAWENVIPFELTT
jgi:hypothetical protein